MLEPTSKALQYFEEEAMHIMKRKVANAKRRLESFEKHYLTLKEKLTDCDFTELNQPSDYEGSICFYFTHPKFPKDLFTVAMELKGDKVWVQSTQKNEQGISCWTQASTFDDINKDEFIQYIDRFLENRAKKNY